MRIAFIVNNERYHNGGARPFFNWNRAISDSGLIRIGYSADSPTGRTESATNAKEAVSVVKDYDLIVVDWGINSFISREPVHLIKNIAHGPTVCQ